MLRSLTVLIATLALLTACGTPKSSPRVGPGFVNGKPVHPLVKMGDPYSIGGETYVPKFEPGYREEGMASWYGPGFHGKSTANGERFDSNALTAAHRTLPMPSMVRVTNLKNGKTAIVRVNDRGPFAHNRIIDLSKAAAQKIDMIGSGVAEVRVEYLQEETERYIAQLGMDKSPQHIEWEQENSVQVASSNDSWYSAAAAPSQPISDSTIQAADVSGVSSTDLPPPSPAPKAPQALAPATTITTQTTTVQLEAPAAVEDGNRSYKHSPFDNLDTEQVAAPVVPKPISTEPASRPPATGDPNAAMASGSYIQVGAFSSKANAERIGGKFSQAQIQGVPPEAPKVYRVRLGPFTDRYSAETMLSEVRESVPDAQLIQQ